jgi:ABC-type nickel/cobalt efflux system permease component RcnA
MRGVLIALLAGVAAAVWWLWPGGGLGQISAWAAEHQRGFQDQMALALRGVRAGRPEAVATLLAACFAYGFFHAVGPGHGKVLIGGYGLARRVAAVRLSAISLLASLGQAVTAILLVYGGVWLFQLSREQLVGTADGLMAPVSYAMIVLIGLWLLVRGLRRVFVRPAPVEHAPHAGGHCDSCGHRHGPTAEEVGELRSWREAALLIAGIAIRPCTGALFVLVITLGMGIPGAGIAGAFAMALGTAVVTIGVGLGAVGLRGGLLQSSTGTLIAQRVVPAIEIAAGSLVVLAAGGLLLRAL